MKTMCKIWYQTFVALVFLPFFIILIFEYKVVRLTFGICYGLSWLTWLACSFLYIFATIPVWLHFLHYIRREAGHHAVYVSSLGAAFSINSVSLCVIAVSPAISPDASNVCLFAKTFNREEIAHVIGYHCFTASLIIIGILVSFGIGPYGTWQARTANIIAALLYIIASCMPNKYYNAAAWLEFFAYSCICLFWIAMIEVPEVVYNEIFWNYSDGHIGYEEVRPLRREEREE